MDMISLEIDSMTHKPLVHLICVALHVSEKNRNVRRHLAAIFEFCSRVATKIESF